jgi:hypothetical protein
MEQIKKPKEWREVMFPYRQVRKELFCTAVRQKLNPMYTKADIIAGIKEMGYNTVEAMYYYNIIEEVKKRGLMQRNGEND